MTTTTTAAETATDRVWNAMTGAYGRSWTSSYGDHDKTGVWAQGLARYHPEQIQQALAAAIKHHAQYPPTLGQFMALCRAAPPPDARYQLEHQQEPTTREGQRQWLLDLREMMDAAKARGPMTAEQRAHHSSVLGLDREEKPQYVAPGSRGACPYPGCSAPGTMSASQHGSKAWYCGKHFSGFNK